MKIALCQYDVVWNNPITNFSIIEELVAGKEMDMLVLPEMFSTGFIIKPTELSDPLAIKTKKWMELQSSQKLILGSVPHKKDNSYFNTLLAYLQGKELVSYNKAHTFIGGERENFTEGDKLGIFHFQDWKISVNICYDLRFPVWCRAQNPEIMIFCANWPAGRREHWYALLKARSIENQCYVIGVNRIGTDANDWHYKGQSLVFDFKGNEILNLEERESCETISISKQELLEYRKEFPFLEDKDEFKLKRLKNAQ